MRPLVVAALVALPAAWALASYPGAAGTVAWRSIGPGEFGAMFGVAISPHDPKVIIAGVDMGNAS